jgi:hypothetical protein
MAGSNDRARLRERVTSSARMSAEFIEKVIPELTHWVLGANLSGRWTWRSRRVAAERWVHAAYASGAEVWVCLGEVGAPLNRAPTEDDILFARVVAASGPSIGGFAKVKDRRPHAAYRTLSGVAVAIWRLAEPVGAEEARWQAGICAAACCTNSFSAMPMEKWCIPVPPDLFALSYHNGSMGIMAFDAPLYTPVKTAPAIPAIGGLIIDGVAREVKADDLEKGRDLVRAFADFRVSITVSEVKIGPVVTTYFAVPGVGVKGAELIKLEADIGRAMRAGSIRIAPIPKSDAIGVEIPNTERQVVRFDEIAKSRQYRDFKGALPVIIGTNVFGEPAIADFAKMPHWLVAGTTGSGKSVGVNATVVSLITGREPDQCRLLLIDPKLTEFSIYNHIPHLLTPVIKTKTEALRALRWLLAEVMDRYERFSEVGGARDLPSYNDRSGEFLPYIVCIIDEVADLVTAVGDRDSDEAKIAKAIAEIIQKLAQIARAAGVHILLSMQRPSAKIIDGEIAANFLTRLAFQVTSGKNSEIILGEWGAENLLGEGDGLFRDRTGRITRVHGAYIDVDDILKIVADLKGTGEPEYVDLGGFDEDGGAESGESDKQDSRLSGRPKRKLDDILHDALKEGKKTWTELFAIASENGYRGKASLDRALIRIGAVKEGKSKFLGSTSWELP